MLLTLGSGTASGTEVSPLVGYNDNIDHRGHVYHVQTEDSGPRRPHVITHLFADGGRIVTSTKTSYKDHVDDEGVEKKVRTLMRAQHKAMLAALQSGEFDEMLEEQAKPPPAPAPPRPRPTGGSAARAPGFAPSGAVVAGAAAAGVPAMDDSAESASAESRSDGTPPAGTPVVLPAPPDWLTDEQAAPSPADESNAPEVLIELGEGLAGAAAPLPLVDLVDDTAVEETKPGRRLPDTDPEVLPPVGSAVPLDVLERAAAEADRDFRQGIHPETDKAGGRRPRKPTPLHGAGTYRYVAPEGRAPEAEPAPEPLPTDSLAPPRRRRYPQTNPGRRKVAGEESGDGPEAEAAGEAGVGLQFGERFLTNRSLDVVILDFLARHLGG